MLSITVVAGVPGHMSALGLVMHPLVVATELISRENEAHDTPAENVNCPIIQRLKGGPEPKRIVMLEFADTAAFKRGTTQIRSPRSASCMFLIKAYCGKAPSYRNPNLTISRGLLRASIVGGEKLWCLVGATYTWLRGRQQRTPT
jgi:hypothetical protein